MFVVGDYVAKLPGSWSAPRFDRWWARNLWRSVLWGLLGNMQEAEFWTTRWSGLCPVLFSVPGGLLVVMPRCDVLSEEEFSSMDYEALVTPGGWYARENLRLRGGRVAVGVHEPASGVIPAERKACSFGWLTRDGVRSVVALDYG